LTVTSTELRWILLIVGIAVLIIIYVFGRKQHARRRSLRAQEEDATGDAVDISFDTRAEHEEFAPESDRFGELQNVLQEEVKTRAPSITAPAPEPGLRPKKPRIKPKPAERPSSSDKIVSLYVVARRAAMFRGEAIRAAAEREDLEYGDMQIFNRVVERNGRRQIVFSMANAVKPGTFDLDHLRTLSTPGLVLFLQLPGPLESLKAFNAMLDCAQRLADELDGELRDETRSVLSNQTIDHMREEIQLYSLRTARTRHGGHAR
jgi:cell division protein ZipA